MTRRVSKTLVSVLAVLLLSAGPFSGTALSSPLRIGVSDIAATQYNSTASLDAVLSEGKRWKSSIIRFVIDPSKSHNDLLGLDRAVNHAVRNGYTPLLTVTPVRGRYISPASFALFARRMADRYYPSGVRYYTLVNEPECCKWLVPSPICVDGTVNGACDRRSLALAYRKMYLRASNAIRRTYPKARIGFGEFSPGIGPTFLSHALRLKRINGQTRFMRGYRPLRMDFIAIHPYASGSPVGIRPGLLWGSFNHLDRIVRWFGRAHRAGAIKSRYVPPVWITEMAWQSSLSKWNVTSVTEAQRAEYEPMALAKACKTPGVSVYIHYQWLAPPSYGGPEPQGWDTSIYTGNVHGSLIPSPAAGSAIDWINSHPQCIRR